MFDILLANHICAIGTVSSTYTGHVLCGKANKHLSTSMQNLVEQVLHKRSAKRRFIQEQTQSRIANFSEFHTLFAPFINFSAFQHLLCNLQEKNMNFSAGDKLKILQCLCSLFTPSKAHLQARPQWKNRIQMDFHRKSDSIFLTLLCYFPVDFWKLHYTVQNKCFHDCSSNDVFVGKGICKSQS